MPSVFKLGLEGTSGDRRAWLLVQLSEAALELRPYKEASLTTLQVGRRAQRTEHRLGDLCGTAIVRLSD